MTPRPETYTIAPNSGNALVVSRLITGLWQLAGGHGQVDVAACTQSMNEYVDAGLTTFDMADHYGPAEQVIGAYHTSGKSGITALTKWCPKPGVVGHDACAAAVDRALLRMGVPSVDLLQYHAWRYDDPSYLTNLYHLAELQRAGKIKQLGVTNMDLLHLRMLHSSGYVLATNQVSMSVLDRRAETGGLAEWCAANDVALLAYGTLLGGFISEKWLGVAEPKDEQLSNWSLKKYKRFIDNSGGWTAFQTVLAALHSIAGKHGVTIPAVATRHVLDIPGVASVIVGSRLAPSESDGSASISASTTTKTQTTNTYIDANLAAFTFTLDEDDRRAIKDAQGGLSDLPGDCGDEYRYPPYLTASGDLGDHLAEADTAAQRDMAAQVEQTIREGGRVEKSSGSPWEPVAGYCRAVRIGDHFVVAGTTTRAHPSGVGVLGGTSAADQTTNVFDIIANAVHSVGASMGDITRTRVFLVNVDQWRGVAHVHGATMARHGIRPANTMVGGSALIGDGILVEVEAEGVVGSSRGQRLRL